jgi:hypothetical protein
MVVPGSNLVTEVCTDSHLLYLSVLMETVWRNLCGRSDALSRVAKMKECATL